MKDSTHVELIGTSRAITDLRAEIAQIARSDAKVLITGESGTGKEVVARAIHAMSARSRAPFVPVNCAGIPETLLESELFGHTRGSFTGAFRDNPGKLESADHGVILLDEIGEMTQRMQGFLLRFLETGEIQKVGAEKLVKVTDVRVLTATSRRLEDLIAEGTFREDLFYRLNVIHLVMPALRERRDDIPLFVDHFLRTFARQSGRAQPGIGSQQHPVRSVASEAMAALVAYDWPGNVRQVENVVQRLVLTCQRTVAQIDDLPFELRNHGRSHNAGRGLDRRQSVADDLYRKLLNDGESFWTLVYPLYMNREITKAQVREVVHKGLKEARGNYKIVLRLFNMGAGDYKRFLGFLRKHECHLPFKQYRSFKDADRPARL